MGNAKSTPGTVAVLDRKRTTKRTGNKTKGEESTQWQPPGPRSYTSVDTELPSGDRGKHDTRTVLFGTVWGVQ